MLYEVITDILSYYDAPSTEKILKMAFVFRNADGSLEGKATGGADIFVDVSEGGLVVGITEPSQASIFQKNQTLTFTAKSSNQATLKLKLDDIVLKENTGTEISTSYVITSYSIHYTKLYDFQPELQRNVD